MAGAPPVPTKAPRPARAVRRAMSDKEKEGRRTDILAAAKKVFARKGYHATTIADIARTAKLSYGSIYWYFDSKDALFHALMEAEGKALRVFRRIEDFTVWLDEVFKVTPPVG